MNRRAVLTITIAALSILGMALGAVAAPNARERNKCYSACNARCAAEYSCERPDASRECFTNFNKCNRTALRLGNKSRCRTDRRGGPRDQSGPKQPQQDIPPFSGRFLDLVLE